MVRARKLRRRSSNGSRHTPVAHWACDWTIGHSRRGSRSAAWQVRQDRVQYGAEHVVLALIERPVADPHPARARVAGQILAAALAADRRGRSGRRHTLNS